MDEEALVPALERLRELVTSCLEKHLLLSAVFFADKLVSLSGAAVDVFLLAQAFFLSGQASRAHALLRAEQLTDASPRFLHLAASCLVAERSWEDALALLGEEKHEVEALMEGGGCGERSAASCALLTCARRLDAALCGGVATAAALSLLRGRVYSALENRSAARRCYLASLRADPRCYEAFDALVGGSTLTSAEAKEVLSKLAFCADDEWLRSLYAATATDTAGEQRDALADMAVTCGLAEGAGAALDANGDVAACRAAGALARGDAAAAYASTHALLRRDPLRASALPVHLAAAFALGKRNELFSRAHALVAARPAAGVSWYAVGCYYACCGQHHAARRFMAKCTVMEPSFAPGWVGYGHAFAALEETDQALAAYRTAARMFPGLHQPMLWAGVEYGRASANWGLAKHFLSEAKKLAPSDLAAHHELGCVALRCGELPAAEEHFRMALRVAPRPLNVAHEPLLVGLASALRRQRRFAEATSLLETAMGLNPSAPGTLAALAFTAHLAGDTPHAVTLYHLALAARPEDGFSHEMLTVAIADSMEEPLRLIEGTMSP